MAAVCADPFEDGVRETSQGAIGDRRGTRDESLWSHQRGASMIWVAMSDTIPSCTLQQLLMVQHAKAKQPELDLPRAIQKAMPEATDEQKLCVAARLIALQNMLRANPSLVSGTLGLTNVTNVNVAIFRAAARAPLEKGVFVHETNFEVASFNAVLREESQGLGQS